MAKNGNTVNIDSEKSAAKAGEGERYHHGDLRSALVEEGMRLLRSVPAEALSLREVARNVGVSATAVYRHFPDKAALLTALSDVGGERIADAFTDAMAAAKSGQDAFNAMGRAYVRFALANPSLFKLMMSQKIESGAGRQTAPRGRQMLIDALREMSGGKMSARELGVRELQAWSIVHGLAMLMLDGQVPADDKIIDQVLESKIV